MDDGKDAVENDAISYGMKRRYFSTLLVGSACGPDCGSQDRPAAAAPTARPQRPVLDGDHDRRR